METMETKQSDDIEQSPEGRGSNKGNGWFLVSAVLLFLAILFLGIFVVQKYRESKAQEQYEALSLQTELKVKEDTPYSVLREIGEAISTSGQEEAVPESSQIPDEERDPIQQLKDMGVPIPEEKNVDFDMLRTQVNEDIYAWIYIPGTNIDYPVLRHPTDNSYYLDHNLDGSKGYPGCIYSEDYNTTDWTDPVTVLYGHDMRSTGTMFHQLHKYEKADFFEENQYIYIYTPDALLVYRIFAAEVHSDEHLLAGHDFQSKEEFENFFHDILQSKASGNLIREDVALPEDGRVVALSTCIKNKASNRFLVYGVLLNE